MESRLLVALAWIGCGGAPQVPANRSSAVVADADPIACPEASLRAFASHFPEARLEIKISASDEQDARGAIELPCQRTESDAACLARGRRAIPRGMIELIASNGGGYIDGEVEWEVTLEIDGKIEVRPWSGPESPEMIKEIYAAIGHRAKLISQRSIPTPDKRHTVIWYGYVRKSRSAALWFGTTDHDVPADRAYELEAKMHLVDKGIYGELRGEGDEEQQYWVVHYTCE